MAFENNLQNTNARIWDNPNKKTENHPSYSGVIHIGVEDLNRLMDVAEAMDPGCDSVSCWVSGWNNENEHEGKVSRHIGLKFSVQEEQRPRENKGSKNWGGRADSDTEADEVPL